MSCMRALDSTPTPRRSPPIYLLFCSLFNFPHTTTSLSSAFSSFCTTTSSITAPSALTRFVLFCIFQVPRTAPCCGLLLRFFFFSARFFFDCLRRLWRFGLYSPARLQLHAVALFYPRHFRCELFSRPAILFPWGFGYIPCLPGSCASIALQLAASFFSSIHLLLSSK
jgi:hypothetical protein